MKWPIDQRCQMCTVRVGGGFCKAGEIRKDLAVEEDTPRCGSRSCLELIRDMCYWALGLLTLKTICPLLKDEA